MKQPSRGHPVTWALLMAMAGMGEGEAQLLRPRKAHWVEHIYAQNCLVVPSDRCQTWGHAVDAISLGLRAQQPTYALGEPVVLSSCYRNDLSWEGNAGSLRDDFFDLRLVAFRADGSPVPETEQAVFAEKWTTNLHGGSCAFWLPPRDQRACDLDASAFLKFSEPGTYTIIAFRFKLVSNAVTVTIVDRAGGRAP